MLTSRINWVGSQKPPEDLRQATGGMNWER
jgi:hypothetical protein